MNLGEEQIPSSLEPDPRHHNLRLKPGFRQETNSKPTRRGFYSFAGARGLLKVSQWIVVSADIQNRLRFSHLLLAPNATGEVAEDGEAAEV